MIRVNFVCLGNICRSPTGEAVLRSMIAERNLDGTIEIDSSGIIDYHAGNPADPRMAHAARQRGFDLTSIARQVTRGDFETFDLLIAMDREVEESLREMAPSDEALVKIRLMGAYHPDADVRDIPDPYYGGGSEGFDLVIDLIETACAELLAEIVREHGLKASGEGGKDEGSADKPQPELS